MPSSGVSAWVTFRTLWGPSDRIPPPPRPRPYFRGADNNELNYREIYQIDVPSKVKSDKIESLTDRLTSHWTC